MLIREISIKKSIKIFEFIYSATSEPEKWVKEITMYTQEAWVNSLD